METPGLGQHSVETPGLGQQNGVLGNQTRARGLESKCDVREAQRVLEIFEYNSKIYNFL